MMRRITVYRALVLAAGLASGAASGEEHHFRSAGCYIATDEGVVLAVRRFGSSLQLPGGMREPGESIACTAQRETAEETGLRVDIAERLLSTRHFALFRCLPREPITRGARLAPRDWVEVEAVVIVDPTTMRDAAGETVPFRWRFERDRELLQRLFRRGGPAPGPVEPTECATRAHSERG